jgi:cephalosporin hydroxylase
MTVTQLTRVAAGVLRDGPIPLLVARRAIRQFDAIQRTWELQSLVALVRRMKPVTVVEIGSYKGGTLACWAAVAQPSAVIVGIDMPFPWVDKPAVAASIGRVRAMLRPAQRLTVMAADSHDAATLAGLREALAGAPIDVLWIDGDHTYDGVRQDVEMYAPLVRPGGIVALHDIQRSDLFPDQKSDVYWQELKAHARTREFIADPTPGAGMGIGVIFVEESGSPAPLLKG